MKSVVPDNINEYFDANLYSMPEYYKKLKDLWEHGELLKAEELSTRVPEELKDNEQIQALRNKISRRGNEVRKWVRDGKISDFSDPIYRYPKFVFAKDYIKTHLGKSELRVLDMGCFTGYFLRDIADSEEFRTQTLSGCDIQHDLMNYLSCVYKGINWFPCSAEDIPKYLASQSSREIQYDVITLFDVLNYVLDMDKALRSAESLCAEGGTILIHLPNERLIDYAFERTRFVDIPSLIEKLGITKCVAHTLEDEHGNATTMIVYKPS